MQDFRPQLDAYLQQQARPVFKYGHQPRLYALTRQIADLTRPAPIYDDDVVYAAAYLHDLGVFIGHRPEDPTALGSWNHVTYTCERTPTILSSVGFPLEKIPAVLAAIGEHQPHDTPTSFEATILRDADIVEQLGAVGILRTASKLGSDTRFHYLTDAKNSLKRALDTLPKLIQLDATRELALPRIHILREFLLALEHEAGEHLG